MSRRDYRCPFCNESNISFLRIEKVGTVEEKAVFLCCFCKNEFSVRDLGAEYLPNLVAILKKKYP